MSVHQWSCCTSQLLKMRLKSTLRSRQTAGTLPADVALNLPSGIVFSFTLILPPGILHDVPGDCLGAPGWLHGARTWYVEMIIWSGGVFIVETPSQMTPFVYYGSSWWHERQCGRDVGGGGTEWGWRGWTNIDLISDTFLHISKAETALLSIGLIYYYKKNPEHVSYDKWCSGWCLTSLSSSGTPVRISPGYYVD